VLLFGCSSFGQDREEDAVREVEPQANPTVQQETETSVEPPIVNVSAGEEVVLVAGLLLADGSNWLAGFAVEGGQITSPGPTIKVRRGETVTITFENAVYLEDGRPFGAPHNFTIVADKDVPLPEMEPLWGAHVGGFGDPNLFEGERGSVTLIAETAGSFFYVCALLDHHIDHGMWGRFIVEE
jgi:FtsP/CotA-like multicopper oxidase with cupredoxin domain